MDAVNLVAFASGQGATATMLLRKFACRPGALVKLAGATRS
ncbi:hypothetical protein [Burkholderia stabilis]|nr:hypothetical protein [Burkholderia stabilis]GAU07180.1 hypothetical protein BSLA_03r1500 [Burkholderia stabilis]